MNAERQGDKLCVTLTPTEAHVLIWGGPQDVIDEVSFELRHRLVDVEDKAFSEDEYRSHFGELDKVYADLRASTASFREETERDGPR